MSHVFTRRLVGANSLSWSCMLMIHYGWLEFVTTYIPVLTTYGYMSCGGSSQLNVGTSVCPRWDSLPGVNWVKVLLLFKFILNG